MQTLICEGSRFNFRFDLSTRIVPRGVVPEVDKRHVDIPVENTQDQSLPEPKKRRAPAGKKKPPKKFHMPDGVETGFQSVASMLKIGGRAKQQHNKRNPELGDLATVPELSKVLLDEEELKELNRAYRNLPFNHSIIEETDMPDMTAHPELQRQLRPVFKLKHGTRTKRFVKMWHKMAHDPESLVLPCRYQDRSNYLEIPVHAFAGSESETEPTDETPTTKAKGIGATASVKKKQNRKPPSKAQPRAKRRRLSSDLALQTFAVGSMVDEGLSEENDEEDDDDEEDEVIPRGRGRPKRGSKPRSKVKRKPRQKNGGLNSDEVGDDCERDSDMIETDGSDNGEDLLDFIVSDNHPMSSGREPVSLRTSFSSASSTSTPESAHDKTTKPFYVPTQFPGTQESDDIPDLGEVLKMTGKQRGQEFSDNDVIVRRTARGRRVVVDESDSD